jgi:hypothetical protein
LNGSSKQDPKDVLAMIERTVEIEAQLGGSPTILDLFKGTDRRRTLITCFAYASQNFAGNLIANQATFFFERKFHPSATFPSQLIYCRGRHVYRLLFPARSHQFMSRIRGKWSRFRFDRILWPKDNLPLRNCLQCMLPRRPRCRSYSQPI